MKKVGSFLFAFVPYILVLLFQSFALFFMPAVTCLTALFTGLGSFRLYGIAGIAAIIEDTDYQMIMMCIYAMISICVFGLWYYSRCNGSFRISGRNVSIPLQIAAIVVLLPGVQFFSNILCSVVGDIWPSILEEYESLIETSGLGSVSAEVILYSVLLAPVCEELIFRGVTLRLFERVLPWFWAANLMQAILFGFFHGNMMQGIYAAVLGLFLGYLCERGGSIWCSILLHMLFNFWGTFIADLLSVLPDTLFVSILLIGVMFLSLAGGLALFYVSNHPDLFEPVFDEEDDESDEADDEFEDNGGFTGAQTEAGNNSGAEQNEG